jgi:hypothetical protein
MALALITAMTAALAVQTPLPTPADLLSDAIQAMGGRRAIERVESFHLHGVMRLPSGRAAVEIELSTGRDGRVLASQTFLGIGQIRFGSDGETAWEETPDAKGTPRYNLIDNKAIDARVRQINWAEWITMLPSRIDDMTVIGQEVFDGEDAWAVAIEHLDGRAESAFFSTTTRRPLGRRTVEKSPSGEAIVSVYFRDWRPVGDLQLLHTVVFDRDGALVELAFDRVEINMVPADRFDLPDAVEHLKEEVAEP